MKNMGFTFNDLDFVVHPFQFASIDGIFTMVHIPNRTLSQSVNCLYFVSALTTNRLKTLVGSHIERSDWPPVW